MSTLNDLKRIAESEFSDIVAETFFIGRKLRIFLKDSSFIDVNLSQIISNRFGFHWECMDATNSIFRFDNFPDTAWKDIPTFPYHFHNGSQQEVEKSPFPPDIMEGFREFMLFIRKKIET